MISQQVVERAAAVLGHAHGTRVIILLDHSVVYFVSVADEDPCDASDGFLDPLTIAITRVAGRRRLSYRFRRIASLVSHDHEDSSV